MLVLNDLGKTYRTRAGDVRALHAVSLQIDKGQFVAVCGPSGSGKTTLLMMIAAMLRPSEGSVQFDGTDVYAISGRERARFRARNIGFVFQMFHLVPYLNVLENVLVAQGASGRRDSGRAEDLLERLGLRRRMYHRPGALSAGEKQRAAMARALLNQPRLILADEPTGNLDPQNAQCVLMHLREFHRAGGTVIVATHGPAAQELATRTIHLRDGTVCA
ncbi:MAG: ABC transporter ATP-binding protein [Phycisphaerae bacterium]|nr:ABC transporter ATP-binding protein [Phycisphaerae bacterium]